ncbi:hypothetical protein NGB36_07265 [Streptomyces sp. RB6PN25]|uniref:Uncharacterized protein n=1 Tax=Streptomyces humicola TaxID=2953240 RepID=A0ABT1PRV5_9ACTN|nr:hypothetical protein [Streptomyces humicola]MCQ4080401.1 hypothetical protein [Streptomyces humicola]
MSTMPVTYDTTDPNRVVPLTGRAQQVWDALKAGAPVPASAPHRVRRVTAPRPRGVVRP